MSQSPASVIIQEHLFHLKPLTVFIRMNLSLTITARVVCLHLVETHFFKQNFWANLAQFEMVFIKKKKQYRA